MILDQVVDAQGGAGFAQDRVHVVPQPARVAHLDRPAEVGGCDA